MAATPTTQYSLVNTYAPAPGTTRGRPIHISGDPKGNNFLYCNERAVFIRNLKNPLQVDMYTEHQHPPTIARYSPSGFYIASGDVAGNVRIWDTVNKEHILKIELKILSGPVLDLQWSEDSKRLVVVGEGKEKFGAVVMWDSGSSVGEISGHSKAILACDFKQTRPYRIVTGSDDTQVNFFEGPPFKFTKSFKEHTRFVTCVRFSPDGNKYISVGTDRAGFIFDGKTGELITKLSTTDAHQGGIYSCSWSPDSKLILTASADKTAKIWDASTGNCVRTFNLALSPTPVPEDQQLGCLWQGQDLLSIGLSGDIAFLNENDNSKPRHVIKGHQKFITALAVDRDAKRFISGSYDALILKWDITTGFADNIQGKGHTNQINRISIQGENLVSCGMDDSIRITPLNGAYGESLGLESNPADLAVGRKDLILAATANSIVVIVGGKIANVHQVKYQPTAIGLSVDETTVAVGGKDNLIHLYRLNGTQLSDGPVLEGHRGALTVVTYSPDGKYLASADTNRDIFVWDIASNKLVIQGWVFHTARVNALSWSPDSLHLVSGSLDGHLYVWSVEATSKRIQVKDAHRGGVNCALWVDNNTVASAGQDCTIKTWSITF